MAFRLFGYPAEQHQNPDAVPAPIPGMVSIPGCRRRMGLILVPGTAF
jgi:hypothetical protein